MTEHVSLQEKIKTQGQCEITDELYHEEINTNVHLTFYFYNDKYIFSEFFPFFWISFGLKLVYKLKKFKVYLWLEIWLDF